MAPTGRRPKAASAGMPMPTQELAHASRGDASGTVDVPMLRDPQHVAKVRQSISTFAMVFLAASCVPPLIAVFFYRPGQRPSSPALEFIDQLFRGYGSLWPLIPLLLRFAAYTMFPQDLQDRKNTPHPAQELMLMALVLIIRMLVYVLHMMGQELIMWLQYGVQARSELHRYHLFADHVVLGVAIQACLVVELGAALHYAWHALVCAEQGRSRTGTPAYVLLGVALLAAAGLLAMSSAEITTTAVFFHVPREVVTGIAAGLGMFGVLAYLNLRQWTRWQS